METLDCIVKLSAKTDAAKFEGRVVGYLGQVVVVVNAKWF